LLWHSFCNYVKELVKLKGRNAGRKCNPVGPEMGVWVDVVTLKLK